MRKTRKKMSIREFQPLTIIGRGAFGEVRICKQKSTGAIVAIKKMRKEEMLKKNQLMHVRTEKEIMTADNPWIVNLKYSFQDEYFLYLVMDYLPGGDLMNLLMKRDILTEDEARFYTAEMILAVDSVHKLNCIHRDLKPDNILIGKDGHIQLSDFGLAKIADKTFYPLSSGKDEDVKCQNEGNDVITTHKPVNAPLGAYTSNNGSKQHKVKKRTRLTAFSTVGTPDYIAPEVFGKEGYGPEVDWWSIGVMLFEMVVGYPPFFSEQPTDTCKKVVKWRQHFSFPQDANLSYETQDLISRFVTNAECRLGRNGVDEIKRHPFFRGIDWDNLRNAKAPFIPQLTNDIDNRYFDNFDEEEPFYPPEMPVKNKKRKDMNYAGYTFNRDVDNMNNNFVHALEVLDVMKLKTTEDETEDNEDEKEVIIDEGTSNTPNVLAVAKHKPSTATTTATTTYNKVGAVAPFKDANKIMIMSDTTTKGVGVGGSSSSNNQKKISKSPEMKSKDKTNTGVNSSVPVKTQRDGGMKGSGNNAKGNTVLSKIKLNSGFGMGVKKNNNHTNYLNTYNDNNTMMNGFGGKMGMNSTISTNKKK